MHVLNLKSRKFIITALAGVLFLAVLLIACRDEDSQLLPQSQPQALIDEYRAYFESNVHDDEMSSIIPDSKGTRFHPKPKKSPRWNQANTRRISLGQAVYVPLSYEKPFGIPRGQAGQLIPCEMLSYLMMYKDTLGEMHTEVVTTIPTDSWVDGPKNDTHPFQGDILVEDWQGNFLKGYRIAEGKVLPLTTPSFNIRTPEKPVSGDAKNQVQVCEDWDVYLYTMYNGVITHEQYLYTITVCAISDDGGTPPSNGTSAGGGTPSGSTTPTDYPPTQPPQDSYSNPCSKAKLISNTPNLTNYLSELKTKAKNLNYEVGYTVNSLSHYTYHEGTLGDCWVDLSTNDYLRMTIHSHHKDCSDLFTLGDIKHIYTLMQKGKISPTGFLMGLINSDGGIYYLSISNLEQFRTFTQGWDQASNFDAQSSSFNNLYNQVINSPINAQETWLLDYLKNSGLTLLKGNANSGWDLIVKGADGKATATSPCTATSIE